MRWQHSTGGEILIGTAARWLYVDPNLAGADVLLDEAHMYKNKARVCNIEELSCPELLRTRRGPHPQTENPGPP